MSYIYLEEEIKKQVAYLEHIGRFYHSPTRRFENFQNKKLRNWKREKEKKRKNRKGKKKKARSDNITLPFFIITSLFIFRSASLCAFSFSTVLFLPL